MLRRFSLHRLGLLAGAIAMVAVVTGCFRVDTTIEISEDGTADLALTFLVDVDTVNEFATELGGEEAADQLSGLTGEDLVRELLEGDDPCELNLPDTLNEPTVSEVEDGAFRGVRCTITDVPLAELNDDEDPETSFNITQDAQGTRVEITLGEVDELFAGADEGLPPGFDMAMDQLLDVRFVVSAPGELVEHNATSTDGSQATWRLTPDAEFAQGGVARMTARWEGSGSGGSSGGSTGLIVVIIVLVVAAAIGGGLVLRSRRSGVPATEMPSGAPTPPPSGGSSPLPPPPPPPPGSQSDAGD